MKIYGIEPKEFTYEWGKMFGTEVGTPGGYHVIIGIQAWGGEPREGGWGVIASHSNRPVIRSNSDDKVGWIARITSFNGESKKMGRILAPDNALACLFVVALGLSEIKTPKGVTKYEEVIITAPPGCEIYVQDTVGPGRIIHFLEKEVVVTPHSLDHLPKNQLTDETVETWRKKYGRPVKASPEPVT